MDGDVRAIQVRGADGEMYAVISNFGSEHVQGHIFDTDYDLNGGECAVYRNQMKLWFLIFFVIYDFNN